MSLKKVLVAEDNLAQLELIKLAFAEVNPTIELVCFNDGMQTIDYLEKSNIYDLSFAIIDFELPFLGGEQLLSTIAKNSRISSLPVIVFSGSKSAEDVLKSYFSGANAFVPKPDDYTGYVRVVEAMLAFWNEINVCAKQEHSVF